MAETQTQKLQAGAAGEAGFPTEGGAGHGQLSPVPAATARVSRASPAGPLPEHYQGTCWQGAPSPGCMGPPSPPHLPPRVLPRS